MAYYENGIFYGFAGEQMETECHDCFATCEAKDLTSWYIENGHRQEIMERFEESEHLLYFYYPRCDCCYANFENEVARLYAELLQLDEEQQPDDDEEEEEEE